MKDPPGVEIVPFREEDCPGLAAVATALFPDPPTMEDDLRADDETGNHARWLTLVELLEGDRG